MVRTLLIDNYDSYTYNLFQLIAEVNGVDPVVVANDSQDCASIDLTQFDNVVISPGPGSPERERDFGVSARIIASAPIPVLGVCLGHQGIGHGFGARVRRAPAARHGHLTAVRHDGEGVFRGLPQDFTAVRYHSLCVDDLPEDLVPTAWAEDGVLMGLRHRTRPLWGVQFHPESIETEYGREMFANFAELTRAFHARRAAAALVAPAATERSPLRLHVRTLSRLVDPEPVYTRLYADSPFGYWLDSARVEAGLSRFSYLGDNSGPLSEVVRYRVDEGAVEVTPTGQPARRVPGDVFDYLQEALSRRRVDSGDLPFDLAGGYVGYFGYELKSDVGGPKKYRSPTPDAFWIFADRFLAFDHEQGVTYAVCVSEDTAAGAESATEWLKQTVQTLLELPEWEAPAPTPRTAADSAQLEPLLVRTREQYLADIDTCKMQLLAGESYEICLTNNVLLPRPVDGYGFYRSMRRHNPAPYAAYLRFGDLEVACSSPERFLRIDRDRVVETKPIKGTAPRGATPEEDERLRDELATSVKTHAENLMIVDLLRNDLGRVCRIGTVTVPKLMKTESYASVHQLVSTIQGELRPENDALDCVRACFPGGSMTGAPKLRTLEIIDTMETEARGVYSGTIGFLSCNGTADLNIVIRTAVLAEDWMRVGAGGAIILDSDRVEEFDEMLLKATAPLRGLLAGAEVAR